MFIFSESDSSSLQDNVLMAIVRDVSPADLEHIAVEYMGIKNHEIQDINAAVREQTEMKKFLILEMWRDRYCGPDARAALLDILNKARKEGLISEEAYQPQLECCSIGRLMGLLLRVPAHP